MSSISINDPATVDGFLPFYILDKLLGITLYDLLTCDGDITPSIYRLVVLDNEKDLPIKEPLFTVSL